MWTFHMLDLSWMAWTVPTAIFFVVIALLIATFTVLEIRYPTVERVGILGIATTRGDRLFISLLGSAFIQLAWLGLVGTSLWPALAIALIYAAFVFWLA
jgi:predicted small integral membrane protein